MKKLFCLLLCAFPISLFGQTSTLISDHMVIGGTPVDTFIAHIHNDSVRINTLITNHISDSTLIALLKANHITDSANITTVVSSSLSAGSNIAITGSGTIGSPYVIASKWYKGNCIFSGITLTTSYTITHGLGFTPSAILIMPTSSNAAAISYVSAITSTTFTITFLTIPILGTNNISFTYLALQP